jgi:hypothetical protein
MATVVAPVSLLNTSRLRRRLSRAGGRGRPAVIAKGQAGTSQRDVPTNRGSAISFSRHQGLGNGVGRGLGVGNGLSAGAGLSRAVSSMVKPTGAKPMLTPGRMSAWARAAPRVINTASNRTILVSGFRFFIFRFPFIFSPFGSFSPRRSLRALPFPSENFGRHCKKIDFYHGLHG